jgi:hypothetical protein
LDFLFKLFKTRFFELAIECFHCNQKNMGETCYAAFLVEIVPATASLWAIRAFKETPA